MNEYGKGLRDWIMGGQHLYGCIDFKSFQVFDEATTYTALQFFSKASNDNVKVVVAPDGVIPDDPWLTDEAGLSYQDLPFCDRWLMTTGADRELIDRIYGACRRLKHPSLTRHIIVGIQTSADAIYHLIRRGPNRYVCNPKGKEAPPPYEVELEDALMKPLVSGAEAKRYIQAVTGTYLLFPYSVDANGARLISEEVMGRDYPNSWAYLRSWEAELRGRESNSFDDNQWYRFGRHQNLDKQEIEKLVVPRLVTNLACSIDSLGTIYLDNVDVGGVSPAPGVSPYFLAGILNAPVADFVFRRISKPFRGDFKSANKQFIAPLPIPSANADEQANIAGRAEHLQQVHTRRRDILNDIIRRLEVVRFRNKPESWLFPDLKSKRELYLDAPAKLEKDARKEFAVQRYKESLEARHAVLGANLRPGVDMDASFEGGELRFSVNGIPVVERVFVADDEGAFIIAQWKLLASTFPVTKKTDGKKLANALRKIGESENPAVVEQVIDLQRALSQAEDEIVQAEAEINALIYRLYVLTDEDINLIETR